LLVGGFTSKSVDITHATVEDSKAEEWFQQKRISLRQKSIPERSLDELGRALEDSQLATTTNELFEHFECSWAPGGEKIGAIILFAAKRLGTETNQKLVVWGISIINLQAIDTAQFVQGHPMNDAEETLKWLGASLKDKFENSFPCNLPVL